MPDGFVRLAWCNGKPCLASSLRRVGAQSVRRRAFRQGTNYHPIFLHRHAWPDHTQAWYDQITVDMRWQAGGTDDSQFLRTTLEPSFM